VYGDALPHDARDEDGDVPVYGSNGSFGYHNTPNTEAPAILIGRKGSCGALNWTDVPSFGIDTVYFIDSRCTHVHLRWLYWALHILGLETMSQDTGVPGLARELAYSTKLPLPSPSEQHAIAAFLDYQTAKIDALVDEQQRLIALLKEKRQAVISHAVTNGLDPNAPMKDSGVEWLGEVPAHWRLERAKRFFRFVKRQDRADLPVLSVYRDFGVIEKSSRDDNINKTPEDLSLYQTVIPGDLVINKMKAWQGSLGVSTLRGITSPDYAVFSSEHVERPAFLNYMLRCKLLPPLYKAISNGIRPDQWRIEPDKFLHLIFVLPSYDEQRAIVEFLDRETAKIDALVAEAETATALLQERRSALISAAVTGKIDVRGLAPIQAEAA